MTARTNNDIDTDVAIKEKQKVKPKLKKPKKYQVVLHNDDVTPMDFVIAILVKVFAHNEASAEKIMWAVHHEGKGIAGVYTKEIAMTKKNEVEAYNRAYALSLKTTVEPVQD